MTTVTHQEAMRETGKQYLQSVRKYVEKCGSSLSGDVVSDQAESLQVFLIPRVGSKTESSDVAVEFLAPCPGPRSRTTCAYGLMGETSPGTSSSKGEFGLNKNTREIGAVLWLALSACWVAPQTTSEPEKRGPIVYPVAKKVDIVDDYHGIKVADPYRWLEDSDSLETVAWVAAENRITMTYLDSIPARSRIKERLTTLYNYERYAGLHKE